MADIAATDRRPGRVDAPQADEGAASVRSAADEDVRPLVTLGEAAGVVGAVAVGMVATVSLALAQLGRHDGMTALALGLGASVLVVCGAWLVGKRPRLRVDAVELGLVAVVGAAAVFFFFPGFPYASVDKDPGVYVAHAFAIARDGDVIVPSDVLERGLDPQMGDTGMFPGFWIESDHPEAVTPQFYHLYPATLATAGDLLGTRGVFHLTPALAVASVCILVLAVRRAASTAASVVFGALMVTSMMQVWQARYPSTEILAQLLLAGAMLGGVLAVERRWAGGAFLSGVLLGIGFLCRPDGFLYILLASVVVALAVAAGRFDRRCVALGLGLLVTFPYAAWNAYDARLRYSTSNSVPRLPLLIGACAAVLVAGVAVKGVMEIIDRRRGRRAERAGQDLDPGEGGLLALLRRWRTPIGVLASLGTGLLLVGLWNRERLLGTHYVFSHFQGETIRSLDEVNIKWLSWFLSMRGLALLWAGVVVASFSRLRAAAYMLLLPAAVLLPLYLWDARISMRLMWWVRRFIPAVLPGVLLLIALALAWALLYKRPSVRLLGAAATASMVFSFAGQSVDLRGHSEMAGSWEAAEQIADVAGDEQGVFLFTSSRSAEDPMRNTPGAVWFIFDQVASRLHPANEMDEIEQYRRAFPENPIFLVTHDQLPPHLPADRFTHVRTVTQQLSMWDESRTEVPDHAVGREHDLVIWELIG